LPFIYDVSWDERVTLPKLRAGAVIELRERAGDQVIRLAPLLRPLVELHWVRMVADLNCLGLVEDDLRRHLFGAERVAFPFALRRGLIELQNGRCFYCPSPLASPGAVDHFVPWSRWPNDAVENLKLPIRPAMDTSPTDSPGRCRCRGGASGWSATAPSS
jgi:hypothetical protein